MRGILSACFVRSKWGQISDDYSRFWPSVFEQQYVNEELQL